MDRFPPGVLAVTHGNRDGMVRPMPASGDIQGIIISRIMRKIQDIDIMVVVDSRMLTVAGLRSDMQYENYIPRVAIISNY